MVTLMQPLTIPEQIAISVAIKAQIETLNKLLDSQREDVRRSAAEQITELASVAAKLGL
jgi:hypothetical protein